MSSYIQMGHDSENLVGDVPGFAGLILSPVNRSEREMMDKLPKFRDMGNFDVVLDPQLYCPQNQRGSLSEHRYFPADLDTADPTSPKWYREIIKDLISEAQSLGVDAVCSPSVLPKKWTADYYSLNRDVYSMLRTQLTGSAIRPIMTVCVALRDLAETNDALRIASIITGARPTECYIVIESETEPRRELSDSLSLASLMVLVSALEKGGCATIVSHCSSDMILMKAAGASHCASGKFFNLRRFTRARFEEQKDGGGGILAYWFEHNLIAFLREADIARLRRNGLDDFLNGGDSDNVFGRQIFEQFINFPGKAWVGLGWRQFLAWFAATEARLSNGDALDQASAWLREAERRWGEIEDKEILMDEQRNNGQWIRPWRQAIAEVRRLD